MTFEHFFVIVIGQMETLQGMARVHRGCTLRASPFCHETPDRRREMKGWVMDIPSNAVASALPVPYNLFHGVAMAMCDLSEAEILALMQQPEETRKRMGRAVDEIMRRVEERGGRRRSTWARCRPAQDGVPASLYGAVKDKEGGIAFVPEANAIIDSEEWVPEMSPDGFIGLYFRWNECKGRESRLCMYVVCQAYLPKACLEFADMVHRLEEACTVGCVCLSEEAQWLRTACARNRARLIAEVSEHMGLRVPLVEDYCAAMRCDQTRPRMALVVTETLHHDLSFIAPAFANQREPGEHVGGSNEDAAWSGGDASNIITAGDVGKVRLLNHCAEACQAFNGSLCTTAPWDSVWVFRGGVAGEEQEGDTFGHICGKRHVMLPTGMPRVGPASAMRPKGLSFTTARPQTCKVLQVWSDGNGGGGSGKWTVAGRACRLPPLSPAYEAAAALQPRAVVQTVEEDVLFAYRKVLAMQGEAEACWNRSMGEDEEEEASQQQQQRTLFGEEETSYLALDEAVLGHMAALGWRRELGCSKLIPLGIALYEHWQRCATRPQEEQREDLNA
jgi:hypothetical protein